MLNSFSSTAGILTREMWSYFITKCRININSMSRSVQQLEGWLPRWRLFTGEAACRKIRRGGQEWEYSEEGPYSREVR